MVKNDNPHQRFIEPIAVPAMPKRARFGGNVQSAEYELNITMREAMGEQTQLPDRSKVGYENIKRAFRK